MKITNAISEFSSKLERFNKANRDAKIGLKDGEDSRLKRLISEKDFAFKKSVVSTYKKYRFPHKALGENSAQADDIFTDEQRLLSAYNLFKAVEEANEKDGDDKTFIKAKIVSPLALKEQYTIGSDLIFLQCWLFFEQKAQDYIPFMQQGEDGKFSLSFQKSESFVFKSQDKEIFSIVKEIFYGGDKA
ncbi:hypothetical protein HRQ91_01905 [Treponema parvum]|uniref:Uncharacterized protein n=1 Tax=Treponema parvum TaxID=138851 RepID=A0A975F2R1_9SPIR|nr:hypothetical protein [Treponema parvum]QTQ13308.1 hypothetical protein HRQ91_01905 [Treponema parvum]